MRKTSHVLIAVATAALLATPLLAFSTGCSSKSSTEPAASTQDAAQTSENAYTGTCRVLTAEELYNLQGDLNEPGLLQGEEGNRYAVIVFDAPTSVYARFAGDSDAMKDEPADMICVAIEGDFPEGNISAWEQYDGSRVTVEIDPMKTMWPSDVRFPVGQPHTGTAAVLSAQ